MTSVPKKQATSIDAQVGSQIRNRRNALGMSQEKLGKLLGLTFQQIQKYERGINRVGAGRLFETARVLGVSILYFYEGVVDKLSGRPVGFAEDAAPAPTPPKSDVAELLATFARIPDEKVRKRVIELVKALASDPPQAKRKSRS